MKLIWYRNLEGPCGAPGHEKPFCPPFLIGSTPVSITFLKFHRVDSSSCYSKEENLHTHQKKKKKKTLLEARLNGPEEIIRRLITWDKIKGLTLSETTALNYCYETPHQILPVGTHSFWGQEPIASPLLGKAIKPFFPPSHKLCLWDSIQPQCREAYLSASVYPCQG